MISIMKYSTTELFLSGNYAGVAMTGSRNEWQTFAALGIIGKSQEAIDGLSNFNHEEVLFYIAVAHWMNGDDEQAKYILKDIPTPHAQNLFAFISKPQIQVIAQTPWDDKDFHDHKFHVSQIGIRRIDSSQDLFEDIHKHYDGNNPPDFYFCNMAEWHILPHNLHELPCPVFGAIADYDAHIQTVYSWLQLFDELIVASREQWEEVRKLTNVPITSYLKIYGLPSSLPFLQSEPRDTDFFLSGTTLNPYHPDKVRIFHQILQMPEIALRYLDGFIDLKSYFSELARAKISCSYVRYPDGMPTRGLEALAMGCAVVTQKESALAFYVDKKHGVVTYGAEENDLPEVIRYVLRNWCEFQKCANRGAELVRREFALPHVISQYLRFLTFLAAKPRLQRHAVQKSDLLQKRGVTKRGFIFPERVNLMMLGLNLQRYEKLVKNDKSPNIFIDTAREAALFLAHGIGQLPKTPDNIASGRKLLNIALNIYKSGLDRFPKSLVLRFNFVRTVFHFGFPSDADEALRLSKEILQSPLLFWEIDVMEDVFPWDFYSNFFNYRKYFDTVKEILMNVTAKRETLVKLILASLHYYVGHYTENIEHFQQAAQMDPEFPFYTYHYARHLLNREGTNDFKEAIELLTTLARDSMLFNEAFSMLEELRSKRKCNIQEFDTITKAVYHFRKSRHIDNPTIERDYWTIHPSQLLQPALSQPIRNKISNA